MDQEQFRLGGRMFETIPDEDITFEQWSWMSVAMEKAGAGDELIGRLEPFVDSAMNQRAMDDTEKRDLSRAVLLRCMEHSAHLDLLAGSLRELGRPWAEESAKANREFFAKLKGNDIQKLADILQQVVIAFFITGLNSILTSPKYSTSREIAGVSAMGAIGETEEEGSDRDSGSESSGK